jgi:hypothetical protein
VISDVAIFMGILSLGVTAYLLDGPRCPPNSILSHNASAGQGFYRRKLDESATREPVIAHG